MTATKQQFNQHTDGVNHINIYSGAQTPMGRWLSPFTFCPVTVQVNDKDESFESIEGLYHWLLTNRSESCNLLREGYGHAVRELGRALRRTQPETSVTPKEVRVGILRQAYKQKILRASEKDRRRFLESTLPFHHYYVMNNRVVCDPKHMWLPNMIEDLRSSLR